MESKDLGFDEIRVAKTAGSLDPKIEKEKEIQIMDKKTINLTINDGDILNVSVRRHTELTIPQFWNIVGEGVECLKVLDDTTLGEFDYIFRLLDVEACAVLHDYWIANWQISDDSFQYLVWWIMSQGREFYYKVLVDPAVIPTDTRELCKLDGEEFRYAVGNEFGRRGIDL